MQISPVKSIYGSFPAVMLFPSLLIYFPRKFMRRDLFMKKWFLLSRKKLAALACVLAAAAMFGVVNYPAVMASATTRQLPIYCVQRDQKTISISFDAAWGDVILRQGI